MIYYNSNTINGWNYGSDNIVKVYRNNAVCYYKITGGGDTPTAQTPCFAVVDDITQYQETEFEDVYDKATEKWYKLNNLNQYEKYGVYGNGRTSCEGSTSRLPQGYTEVEYIENTGTSTINTNFYPNTNTRVLCEMEMITTQSYPKLFGAGTWNANNSLYIEFATSLSVHWIGSTSTYSDYPKSFAFAKHKYDLDKGNLYINDTLVGTKTYSSVVSVSSPFGIFSYINGSTAGNADEHFLGKLYTFKIYDDGTLVREFIPAKRDSDNVAGLYDIVNDAFYTPMETNAPLVAGEPITPTDCVTTYEGKLTIDDGYEYQYSGGSWVNVGEVSGSSRVPAGYSEVEYTESSGSQYIDTDAYLDTSNFEIGYTIVGSKQLFGYSHQRKSSGTWLGAEQSAILFWGDNSNSVSISSYLTSSGNTVTFSPTGATINGSDISKSLSMGSDSIENIPLIIFARYNFYDNTIEFRGSDSYSKFSSFYLKNNGELVRDFIAAKRDNDNEYGLYDLVSNTFFTSPNGNSFTGGATTGITVYPVYYDEKSDPPDNLSFSSMTEAESYECPWWGMSADIDNTDYMFCEGNEWLTKYTYIEVSGDYLCDNGNKYKKMQEYDRIPDGTTTATTTYVKGDLIESASTDCSTDYSTYYLTLVAQTDNVTFSYSTATSSNKLQYSIDGGSTWVDLGNNQSTSSINNGDRIMFKASGLTVNTERGIGKIIPSSSATVEGNIMSLAYGDNFSGQTVIPNNYQFRKLFSGVITITSAENMVLPATTVKQQCYSQMFQGCTSLVVSPKVIGSSAMTWSGQYCLSDMFHDCTSLTTVPSGLLPATTLGERCYWCMFNNCTSLTTAPTLPATTLVSNCYLEMFKGCTNLNYIEALFTTTPSSSYMSNWVNGVASSGTFVKNSSATWSTSCGASTYPCNWTVQNG